MQHRTTQTLKFMQSARLLKIIKYDPTQYINLNKVNHLLIESDSRMRHQEQKKLALNPIGTQPKRQSSIHKLQESNFNISGILQQVAGTNAFLSEVTSILKEINHHKQNQLQPNFIPRNQASPRDYDKQRRMNAFEPTAAGVISSPDPHKQTSI